MGYDNKIHLRVKRDKKNWWFNFSKWNIRVQLCWDSRKWWFYIKQYADKLWKTEFMQDLTDILWAMADDWNQAIFSLYELPEVLKWEEKI